PGELGGDEAAAAAEAEAQFLVGEQATDPLGVLSGLVRHECETSQAILHDGRKASNTSRDHGGPAGGRLERDQTERFAVGGDYADGCQAEVARERRLIDRPEEPHLAADAER